jgi:group I intron endonuclease
LIIYEATNVTNGKVYVGLTTTNLKQRKGSHLRSAKSGSKSYFHKAIRKYGSESFEWDVILLATEVTKLCSLERMVIAMYEPWQTYNVSLGGEHSAYGMKHSDTTKKLCREYAKARWEGKRAVDKYPKEAYLCRSYKEALMKYGVPKTTWYRHKT